MKPIIIQGPAGSGKTTLAYLIAKLMNREPRPLLEVASSDAWSLNNYLPIIDNYKLTPRNISALLSLEYIAIVTTIDSVPVDCGLQVIYLRRGFMEASHGTS